MQRARPWLAGLFASACLFAALWAAEPAKSPPRRADGIPDLPTIQKRITPSPASRAVTVGPKKARPPSAEPIDDDKLEAMLAELGYEIKTTSYTDRIGNKRKYLQVAGPNFWIDICLGGGPTQDESVFVICNLLEIPDLAQVPTEKMLAILAVNDSYFGHIFLAKNSDGVAQLKAIKCIANLNMSPALLQRTIENFDQFLVQNKPVWDANSGWSK